jgi:muramidase (phage lysozyme)
VLSPNETAFLTMLAHSEGTDRAPDPYRVVYGYSHTIADPRDHPAVTGEWLGAPLPDEYCTRAGLSAPCHSSAAGRYQITKGTWLRLKARLSLPDFTGPSQDAAAVELLAEAGSLGLVNSGSIEAAVNIEHGEWASLPGSTSGQPQTPMLALLAAYTGAGGRLA